MYNDHPAFQIYEKERKDIEFIDSVFIKQKLIFSVGWIMKYLYW